MEVLGVFFNLWETASREKRACNASSKRVIIHGLMMVPFQ
jgi:hypothetical protein